jgi:hypothetical protein
LSPDLYPLFLMALRAGLRKGELIAVKWGDIQFGTSEDDPNRYLLVQRNFLHGKFTTPKSKKSRRVDLSRELRSCLLELRDTRLLAAMMAGKTGIADDLIFHSKAGTVLDPNNLVHYHFLPCLEHAGLRRVRFHDLRHTFGSLLIQDGASLAYVKEQMGHSSIQITVDTYGHLIPGADINWIDGLDRRTSQQQNATPAQPVAAQAEPETLEVVEEVGERGRNRTFNLLIKSQLLCQLSYAPVSGLSFSPGDPPNLSRVAGDRCMLQPGSCLPEPLDQLTANNVNEYNTRDCSRTNRGDRGLRAMDYERRSALERSLANGDTASAIHALEPTGLGAMGGRRSRVPRMGDSHPFSSVSGTKWGSTHIASITRRCREVNTCKGSTLK